MQIILVKGLTRQSALLRKHLCHICILWSTFLFWLCGQLIFFPDILWVLDIKIIIRGCLFWYIVVLLHAFKARDKFSIDKYSDCKQMQ